MDNRIYNCVFCIRHDECDLEAQKDHGYNLRDGRDDCFIPHGKTIPPWLNPFSECYGCVDHSYDVCGACFKGE